MRKGENTFSHHCNAMWNFIFITQKDKIAVVKWTEQK